MYETDSNPDRGLAPKTRRRMREVFGGQTCCRCGEPAARLRGEQFYCPGHFPRRAAGEPYQPRVYRCASLVPG
jgi:hypothetical protein